MEILDEEQEIGLFNATIPTPIIIGYKVRAQWSEISNFTIEFAPTYKQKGKIN